MRFAFTDEQTDCRDAVRDLLARECSPAVVRAAWENADGRSGGVWDLLAEMGVLGTLPLFAWSLALAAGALRRGAPDAPSARPIARMLLAARQHIGQQVVFRNRALTCRNRITARAFTGADF